MTFEKKVVFNKLLPKKWKHQVVSNDRFKSRVQDSKDYLIDKTIKPIDDVVTVYSDAQYWLI